MHPKTHPPVNMYVPLCFVDVSTFMCIYFYACVGSCIFSSSSSSSCRAICSIVHHSRKVSQATSCFGTELLYISSSWSSYIFSVCLCAETHNFFTLAKNVILVYLLGRLCRRPLPLRSEFDTH